MNQDVFVLEQNHATDMRLKLEKAIGLLEGEGDSILKTIKEQNRQMFEHLGSAPGDFGQIAEFSQYLMMEKQLLEQKGYHQKKLDLYIKLQEKLYFARIDYKEENVDEFEALYIGYGNFMDDNTLNIHIYDWRTPIASVYYDYQTGPVKYVAPEGEIYGEVSLKRQFDIKDGKLISFYDTKAHIVDERLIEVLSERKSGHMGGIVETIQAEQNRIIREKKAPAIFVEGIAGSGKTVVALHRIAYLMYHGLKDNLSAHQVLILSPNDLFSDYISRVIPDLGEERVLTVTLQDLIEKIMDKSLAHESVYNRLERSLNADRTTPSDLSGLTEIENVSDRLKKSSEMAELLDRWISAFPKTHLVYNDFYYDKTLVGTGKEMRRFVNDPLSNRPLMKRLSRYAERVKSKAKDAEKSYYKELVEKYKNSGEYPFDYREVANLERQKTNQAFYEQLNQALSVDALSTYIQLLKKPEIWCDVFYHESIEQIKMMCAHTLKSIELGRMSFSDLVAICYIHVLINGDNPLKTIKHVVVDESQDYSMMSFILMKKLFSHAHFTVLGDHHQTIQGQRNGSHHENVAQMRGFENSVHMNLTVGYRNVQAIGALCLGLFQGEKNYQMVPREGDKPHCYLGKDSLKRAIEHLENSKYETIAVITKNMKEARVLYETYFEHPRAELIDDHSLAIKKGLIFLPVYLAKGMEFDSVIIANADERHYADERERQLLYVCASRALHALCIQSNEALSPILLEQAQLLDIIEG